EVCELASLRRHAIQVGRGVSLRPKGTNVAITLVINENDNDVWEPFSGGRRKAQEQSGKKKLAVCVHINSCLRSRNWCLQANENKRTSSFETASKRRIGVL